MSESKKPIYTKWWVWLVAVVLIIGIYGVATNEERTAERNNTDEVEATAEIEDTQDGAEDPVEAPENDSSWDDVKNKDNIVGKSDKDFSELSDSKPTDVRNDNTGNWRKSSVTDNVDILEYASSYQDLHMEDGEVHHIINFTMNTTAKLNEMDGLLYVDVKERVEGEEHDASSLGSGMLLKSYVIYPDGDIEEIE